MNAIRRSVFNLLAVTLASGAVLTTPLAAFSAAAAAPKKAEKAKAEKTETAAAESQAPVTVYSYRDPETEKLYVFSYKPTPRSELAKISPSKYRAQMRGFGPKYTLGGSAKKLMLDFPAEYLAFTLAMGLSQGLHLENNPVFLKNFVDENFSAIGGVSFGGFLVGARSTHSFLQMLGLAHDPWRSVWNYNLVTPYVTGGSVTLPLPDAKGRIWNQTLEAPPQPRYFETRAVATPGAPTRVQEKFSPIASPMGLAVGVFVSNVIHEIYADENLQNCVKATMTPPPKLANAEATALIEKTIDEACDKAWEDWHALKKAGDYAPDILSMVAAAVIQGKIANPLIKKTWQAAAKGATKASARAGVQLGTDAATGAIRATAVREGSERIVPVILRGAQIARGAAGMSPIGRFALTVGNIWLFMEIIHVQPPIKQPWERLRQGLDITNRINVLYSELDRAEKNKWDWQPIPSSEFCNGFETDAMGAPTPNMACFEPKQFEPEILLKKMAERQAKWREFVLQDAFLAHKNWQSYVADYATMYGDATAFYSHIIGQINYQRFSPDAATRPSYLYDKEPLFGGVPDRGYINSEGEVLQVIKDARQWLETYLEGTRLRARDVTYQMPATEQVALPVILLGLQATDKSIPLRNLAPDMELYGADKMNVAQRADYERRMRARLFENGIAKLREVLRADPHYTDRHVSIESPEYERRAEKNPFMALRLRLGSAEPLPPGQMYVRLANNFPTLIEQTSKDKHPEGIGLVRTSRMTDFLLASMVCGPEADPRYSDEEKIKIFKKRKPKEFEQFYKDQGLGQRALNANDAAVLIAVQEEIEESRTPTKSWIPNPRNNATSNEWLGFSADFRPPRIVDGVPASICQNWADNSNRRSGPKYEGATAVWTIGGVKYEGMLDIVRKKIRADVVGTSLIPNDAKETPFSKWWDVVVNKHTETMVKKFRASFRSILKDKYIPALNGTIPDGFWNSVFQGVGILKEGSVEYNGRTFQLGALESLYAEANFYFTILGKVAPARYHPAEFKKLSESLILEYRSLGILVTNLDLVETKGHLAQEQFEYRKKAIETKIEDLKKFVDEAQKANGIEGDGVKVKDQAFKNLTALLGELTSYWGVIRTIQVSPAM